MSEYLCRYCRQSGEPVSGTCAWCGAPADVRAMVSETGWVRQPPIRDMARLQFGQSFCQIAGTTVPVAEFQLASSAWIYFTHQVLLWAEPAARLENMPLRGGWKRMRAGLPLIMTQATGPGRLALAENQAGAVVALPLSRGQRIWVREHRFLVATGNVSYDWEQVPVWYETVQRKNGEDERETHHPMGRSGDIFAARDTPGLVLLHAPGNTFIRDLRAGETLLVQPSALLYRDPTVNVSLHFEYPDTGGLPFWVNKRGYRGIWARLAGPGRVAVQSVYEWPEFNHDRIGRHSPATQASW